MRCQVTHGPLVLAGSGALLGELGLCLALSFPCAWLPPALPGLSCLCSTLQAAPHGLCPSLWAQQAGAGPKGWFGDSRNRLGGGCGDIQPPDAQSCPSAWLGAVAHACAPAPGGGTSPVWVAQCVPVVFQRCQRSQCPGALSLPHVSTPGAPAASAFAFPSLHPGLLLHRCWLGLLWLWGQP